MSYLNDRPAIWFSESRALLGSAGVFTGNSRPSNGGDLNGNVSNQCYFNAFVLSDQSGSLVINVNPDGFGFVKCETVAIVANTPTFVSVPVIGAAYQVVYTNGATPQTVFVLSTSYTLAGANIAASSGGGGASGSVTAAGINGTLAQAVQGITGGVPIPVTGTVTENNASVGVNGATIPTSSTQIGWSDGGGDLQPISTSKPLPIGDGTNVISVETVSADGVSLTQNRVRVTAVQKVFNGTTLDIVRGGISAIVSSFTGFINSLIYGVYNSSPITLTNGQGAPLQQDVNGNLKIVSPLGQQVMASSASVAIASDQSPLEMQVPFLISPSQANNVSTTGGIAQASVQPGQNLSLCIQVINLTATALSLASATTTAGSNVVTMASTTGAQIGQNVTGTGIPIGAFITNVVTNTSITLNCPATANGTVTLASTAGQLVGNWQWSANGTVWNTLSVSPKTLTYQSAQVTSVFSAGLWLAQVPATGQFVRLNVTTITNLVINAFVDSFQPNSRVNLPLFYCNSATAANYPTGAAFIPPIDTGGLSDYVIDLITLSGTTQALAAQQSNDSLLQNLYTVLCAPLTSATPANGANLSNPNNMYWLTCKGKYLTGKLTYAALTSLNIGGFTGKVCLTEYPTLQSVSLAQVGSNGIATASPGASSFSQVVIAGAGAVNVDYTAQAWSAASGSGALIVCAPGTAISFVVNVSAWVAGSSTGLDIFLQASPDNGTTWYDIWQLPPFTGTGTDYIPAITIPGRRRMRWVNRGGAATTATVTVTAECCSHTAPPLVQYLDHTAGLLSGTLNATSSAYSTWGCNVLKMWIVLGAATTAGTYQMQTSLDGTNWDNIGTAQIGTASSTVTATVTGVSARFVRVICTLAGSVQTGTYIGITGSMQ